MNIYQYVDMTRANADGSFAVYLIVKNSAGRFFVNTGLKATGKLAGMVFPKKEPNGKQKTVVLCKYVSDAERVCLQGEALGLSNKELKDKIQHEVFGVMPKVKTWRLHNEIAAFAETKRDSTCTLYMITARKVESFDRKATYESVDADWLDRFHDDCIGKGMKTNGAGKELRNIRAVFNWARRQKKTTNYPFLDYTIQEEDTEPNNISVEQLRMLRDYKCESWQEKYRDFFMLSFYLAGINPVDLLSLRADSVRDGHITYVRQKTNKQGQRKVHYITIPVVAEAKAIIERYKSDDGWLLSFMDGRSDYHSFAKKCNKALKKIGTKEMLPDKLGKMRKTKYHPILSDITLYTARYTFGSIAANDLDISERTIGQCLGHSWSRNVTAKYMATDQRKIDNAVKRVVEFVNGK